MKVLHICPSFFPATYWGGPIFSTKALCDALAARGDCEITVLTTDAAGPGRHNSLELSTNHVRFEAGYDVHYFSRIARSSTSPALARAIWSNVARYDVIHFSGTYSFPTLPVLISSRLHQKPVVWSPRGALQATEEWPEVASRKPKLLFEQICQVVRPYNTILHTTSEVENEKSDKRLPGIRKCIIPNIVQPPIVPPENTNRADGKFRLIFLGRLDRKKGLDILIDIIAMLPSDVVLDVYGTGNADYIYHLNRRVEDLGLSNRVFMYGEVVGEAKARAFYRADLFVLPTFSENFGNAIAEALAHGVPVITTHHAPWKGLETHHCGAWISLKQQEWVSTINQMRHADLKTMGQNGANWMKSEFSPDAIAARFYNLYSGFFEPSFEDVIMAAQSPKAKVKEQPIYR